MKNDFILCFLLIEFFVSLGKTLEISARFSKIEAKNEE